MIHVHSRFIQENTKGNGIPVPIAILIQGIIHNFHVLTAMNTIKVIQMMNIMGLADIVTIVMHVFHVIPPGMAKGVSITANPASL
jgi:hypothetical protein